MKVCESLRSICKFKDKHKKVSGAYMIYYCSYCLILMQWCFSFIYFVTYRNVSINLILQYIMCLMLNNYVFGILAWCISFSVNSPSTILIHIVYRPYTLSFMCMWKNIFSSFIFASSGEISMANLLCNTPIINCAKENSDNIVHSAMFVIRQC